MAHVGSVASFATLAPHVHLGRDGWREALDGADLLLVEPPLPSDHAPLGEVVASCREAAIPLVVHLRDATGLRAARHHPADLLTAADLVVSDDAALADAATITTSAVDAETFNPVGWEQDPDPTALLVVTASPSDAVVALLRPVADRLSVRVTGEVDVDGLGPELAARVTGRLTGPHDLADAARTHHAAITADTLHHDPTTHRRLALALTACGTPTLTLDTDLTDLNPHLAHTPTTGDLTDALDHLTDPTEREHTSIRTRRHTLSHHTTRHRLDEILTHLDIPLPAPPTISILLATNRPAFLDHAYTQIARQSYPHLELVTICHGDGFDPDHLRHLNATLDHPTHVVHAPAHWTLGDALNAGIDTATGRLIAKMDDDDYYGPDHLTDLHLALTYSHADITGRWANFIYLADHDLTMCRQLAREERYVTHLPGATTLMPRETLDRFRFSRVRSGVDSALYLRLRPVGGKLYSTHRYNFMRYRGSGHTYAKSDDDFLAEAEGEVLPGRAEDAMTI